MSSAPEGNPREDQGDRRSFWGIFLVCGQGFGEKTNVHGVFVCKDLDVFLMPRKFGGKNSPPLFDEELFPTTGRW